MKELIEKLEKTKEDLHFLMKMNIWNAASGEIMEDFPKVLKDNFNIDCTKPNAFNLILSYGKKEKKQSEITYNEIWEIAKEFYQRNEEKYNYIGIRFENLERKIGETCNNSRANLDREDIRDYPEYGSDEYKSLEKLNGTCAYDLSKNGTYDFNADKGNEPASSKVLTDHCYIIVGEEISNDYAEDDHELIIKNAKVVKQLF